MTAKDGTVGRMGILRAAGVADVVDASP